MAPVEANIHATTGELMVVVFYMQYMSYQILNMHRKKDMHLVLPRTTCLFFESSSCSGIRPGAY
jgi:hypothetical protein